MSFDAADTPRRRDWQSATWVAVATGIVAGLIVMLPQAWSVWRRGTFLDPDDAMRTVEIRDFLAGQAWFDMVPHRLAPDHPVVMHWSRLVDAPLAALQRVFEAGLPVPQAERAMRIVAPLLFFLLALLALLRIVRRTIGPRAMLPAALLLACSAEPMGNFLPGHIHHHGLQAALLLATVAALLDLDDSSARGAAASGALAMLSLGVGLQNLPFVVVIVATVLLLWTVHGERRRRALVGFGLGLLLALPVFLLDVPPERYLYGDCDAFSAAHLLGALATATLAVVLAGLTPWLRRRSARFAAAAIGATVVLGLLVSVFPQCLGDPMSGVDPLLREQWLSGVGEALPLYRLVAIAPSQGIALLLTLVGGLTATGLAGMASEGEQRQRWLVLFGLSAIGALGTLWQVRVAASTCTLLIPGATWLTLQAYHWAHRHPGAPALLVGCLAGVAGNGAGWNAMALPLARIGNESAAQGRNAAACFDPANLARLATLPSGLVLSTIDPGSAILAATSHSVLAAPYHRNAYGNRVSLLALAAEPEAAREMIAAADVRYVALCRSSNETAETILRYPASLSAVLLTGPVPTWLRPVGPSDDTYLLFQVR